jgi:hypothetical protein
MFEKAIKANGEIIEANIINLFSFILRDSTLNGVKTLFKTIQITLLNSWNKHFISDSKL